MTRPKTAFNVHTVHVTASLFAVLGREGTVARLMRPPGLLELSKSKLDSSRDVLILILMLISLLVILLLTLRQWR